jgi:hypothetical protein
MSEKIVVGIADVVTGENEIKELTGIELADFVAERKVYNDAKESLEEKNKTDKEALLLKLGISEEESRLLLS